MGCRYILSHAEPNARGAGAILCPKALTYEVVHSDLDDNGRIVMLEMKLGDKNILLCNLYAPTEDHGVRQNKQNTFLDTVRSKLTHYQDSDVSVVLGGDMNTYFR